MRRVGRLIEPFHGSNCDSQSGSVCKSHRYSMSVLAKLVPVWKLRIGRPGGWAHPFRFALFR